MGSRAAGHQSGKRLPLLRGRSQHDRREGIEAARPYRLRQGHGADAGQSVAGEFADLHRRGLQRAAGSTGGARHRRQDDLELHQSPVRHTRGRGLCVLRSADRDEISTAPHLGVNHHLPEVGLQENGCRGWKA
ncbi:hypothetical protein G6F35_016463 [Rhizopus arrhizus]|nr:hypothetical protein G6F35_016463 [Rhizopus arrhizus]